MKNIIYIVTLVLVASVSFLGNFPLAAMVEEKEVSREVFNPLQGFLKIRKEIDEKLKEEFKAFNQNRNNISLMQKEVEKNKFADTSLTLILLKNLKGLQKPLMKRAKSLRSKLLNHAESLKATLIEETREKVIYETVMGSCNSVIKDVTEHDQYFEEQFNETFKKLSSLDKASFLYSLKPALELRRKECLALHEDMANKVKSFCGTLLILKAGCSREGLQNSETRSSLLINLLSMNGEIKENKTQEEQVTQEKEEGGKPSATRKSNKKKERRRKRKLKGKEKTEDTTQPTNVKNEKPDLKVTKSALQDLVPDSQKKTRKKRNKKKAEPSSDTNPTTALPSSLPQGKKVEEVNSLPSGPQPLPLEDPEELEVDSDLPPLIDGEQLTLLPPGVESEEESENLKKEEVSLPPKPLFLPTKTNEETEFQNEVLSIVEDELGQILPKEGEMTSMPTRKLKNPKKENLNPDNASKEKQKKKGKQRKPLSLKDTVNKMKKEKKEKREKKEKKSVSSAVQEATQTTVNYAKKATKQLKKMRDGCLEQKAMSLIETLSHLNINERGQGKPESLKQGGFSRRIRGKERVVYDRDEEGRIIIKSVYGYHK
jgi:Txe/YoeB family toxin of Txe-Axe toxin-antitoxin module